jgi:hypothetical protein
MFYISHTYVQRADSWQLYIEDLRGIERTVNIVWVNSQGGMDVTLGTSGGGEEWIQDIGGGREGNI